MVSRQTISWKRGSFKWFQRKLLRNFFGGLKRLSYCLGRVVFDREAFVFKIDKMARVWTQQNGGRLSNGGGKKIEGAVCCFLLFVFVFSN